MSKGKILVTGASGLIGKALVPLLQSKDYEVVSLSRISKSYFNNVVTYVWDIEAGYIDSHAFYKVDYIIHLAGEGVADEKWTEGRKKKLYNSRIKGTKLLFQYVEKLENKPKAIIAASGIGIYGIDTGDKWISEKEEKENDFLANLTSDWEKELCKFENLGVRTVVLRTGIVLSNLGGALPKLVAPIKNFIGSPLGDGNQYISWIHFYDLVRLYLYALENDLEGKYNAVSSEPLSNKEFTYHVASIINRKIFLPNIPSFILKILLGEMSTLLLGGNRVSNQKLLDVGFQFKYATAKEALENLLVK